MSLYLQLGRFSLSIFRFSERLCNWQKRFNWGTTGSCLIFTFYLSFWLGGWHHFLGQIVEKHCSFAELYCSVDNTLDNNTPTGDNNSNDNSDDDNNNNHDIDEWW